MAESVKPDEESTDPDVLQERALKVLRDVIANYEASPELLLDRGLQGFLQLSEHLRKLNADRYSVYDTRTLGKLSDEELDDLERKAKGEG